MYQGRLTRREFLMDATGLVAIAQAAAPSLFAQTEPIRGFQGLREYGVKLYDETETNNYQRDENGNFRMRFDREQKFPVLFDGEMSGRKVSVLVPPRTRSEEYSLEAKTYFNRQDISFGGNPDLDDLANSFLFPHYASTAFFDKGIKGNLQGKGDIVTAVSLNPRGVEYEYSMFTGDGGYYYAHFSLPQNFKEKDIDKRAQDLVSNVRRLGFSEDATGNLLGILTSFDHLPFRTYSHVPFVELNFLDGVAWYSPTGVLHSYWFLRINQTRSGINVGTQPRRIGSYSKTTHAQLQRRREQATANGNRQYVELLQNTIDTLVQEGKISLR